MATLKEKRDMIAKYPKEGIKVCSWLPAWPDGGEWGKDYILSTIDYMIFLEETPEMKTEYLEYQRNYGGLINRAYEVAKSEVGN